MKNTGNKTWTATRFKNLYRHKSGTYYARLQIDDKKTWRSLSTKLLSIARQELEELLDNEEKRSELHDDGKDWKCVSDVMREKETQIQNDASTKEGTKKYWREIHAALRRSWPELESIPISKVKPAQCEKWAGRYVGEVSPTRYNNTLSALKNIFALAVERGIRRTNPAGHLKRVPPRQKDLTTKLPNRETFNTWVAAIRKSPNRWAQDCGDLVEFLAYTGLRIGEARCVEWRHCDRQRGEVLVVGDPVEGTKNRKIRRVPIISDLEDLLSRIEARIGKQPQEANVIRVSVAKTAMNSAADKVGMEHITHHDLRHLFATTCIESGVDIPTVAKWLGHRDGGALAMKVYGHLRNEHSLAAAKKVSFR